MARKTNKATTNRQFPVLDLAVAALAGGSVAFALFAMPAELFSRLIELSRLPSLVAAAEPPLGATARLVAVGSGGLFAFLCVYLLMRALDRPSQRSARPAPAAEPIEALREEAVPRLRRADAHPDAPARRPIFAARDFGEIETVEPEPVQDEYVTSEAEMEPLPHSIFGGPEDSPALAEPVEEEEAPAPAAATPAPEPEVRPSWVPLPDPEPVHFAAPEQPEDPAAEGAIPELLARLEGGLKKRGQALPPPPQLEPASEEPAAGHSLRSALRDLQKMAGGAAA
jgi:hypothetical protein